jgi:hypothetical protein
LPQFGKNPGRNALTSNNDKGMTEQKQLIFQGSITVGWGFLLIHDFSFHKHFGGNSGTFQI